jgi:Ras-related protein Rab-2A
MAGYGPHQPYQTYGGGGAGRDSLGVSSQESGGAQNYQYLFKFIIIGDEAVGKTCLLLQFTDKRYRTTHQVTVGVEFGSRTVELSGKMIKLQCWDTAGQDRFRAIVRSYYRGAAGALLVYDITRRDSFDHVSQWLQEARTNADPDLVITLVGNKCDKGAERQVSYEEGHEFAHHHGLYFLETSAVTGHMVDQAFTATARLVHARNVQNAVYDNAPPAIQGNNEYLNHGINASSATHGGLRLSPNGAVSQQQRQEESCCG